MCPAACRSLVSANFSHAVLICRRVGRRIFSLMTAVDICRIKVKSGSCLLEVLVPAAVVSQPGSPSACHPAGTFPAAAWAKLLKLGWL